jgi:hypothetical protein
MQGRLIKMVTVDIFYCALAAIQILRGGDHIKSALVIIVYAFFANMGLWYYYDPSRIKKKGLFRSLLRLCAWVFIITVPLTLSQAIISKDIVAYLTVLWTLIVAGLSLKAAEYDLGNTPANQEGA